MSRAAIAHLPPEQTIQNTESLRIEHSFRVVASCLQGVPANQPNHKT